MQNPAAFVGRTGQAQLELVRAIAGIAKARRRGNGAPRNREGRRRRNVKRRSMIWSPRRSGARSSRNPSKILISACAPAGRQDGRQFAHLLRSRRERPRYRATEQRDEIPPSQI